MATEFDPIRALQEELSGLHVVQAALDRTESGLQARMGEIERQLMDHMKITGFLRVEIERKQSMMTTLIAKRESGN